MDFGDSRNFRRAAELFDDLIRCHGTYVAIFAQSRKRPERLRRKKVV